MQIPQDTCPNAKIMEPLEFALWHLASGHVHWGIGIEPATLALIGTLPLAYALRHCSFWTFALRYWHWSH